MASTAAPGAGCLIVVGTGIEALGQITPAARRAVEQADDVVYSVGDPLTVEWITSINPRAESLFSFYRPGQDRRLTYAAQAERILRSVRTGRRVCAVFYGHPGMLVDPARLAIEQARAEGFPARMLPGVSSFDCLMADLGFDPSDGCQMYEATDFLLRRRLADSSTPLVLWQLGVVGHLEHQPGELSLDGVAVLAEALAERYGTAHEVVVYEATTFGACEPQVERVALLDLVKAHITRGSTLFVPPLREPEVDLDIAERLGLLS